MTEQSRDRRIIGLLAITLLAYYLLTLGGHHYSKDGIVMFQSAKQLLFRGSLTLDPPVIWAGTIRASVYGIGMTLAYLPLLAIWWPVFHGFPGYTTTPYDPALPFNQALNANLAYLLCSVLNPMITTATACVVFRVARLLGLSPAWSLVAAVTYGVASPAAAYARYDFAQPLAGLALIVAAWQLLEARRRAALGRYVASGFCLAYGIMTRPEFLSVAVWAVVWTWIANRRQPVRAVLTRVAAVLVPVMVAVAAYLLVSRLKFGDPRRLGYAVSRGLFRFDLATLGEGLSGLLISPTVGILVFFPLSVLAVLGLFRLARLCPGAALLFAGFLAALAAVYSSFVTWWGGWSWGPRFFVPLLPIITLAATVWAARADLLRARWRRLVFTALALLGFAFSLNGIIFDFNNHRLWVVTALKLPGWPRDHFRLAASPLVTGWSNPPNRQLDIVWIRMLDSSQVGVHERLHGAVSKATGIDSTRVAAAVAAGGLVALLAIVSAGTYVLWTLVRAAPATPSTIGAAPAAPSGPDEEAFWADVSTNFPSLKGAASTAYYFDCERGLFERFLPDLTGRSLLKTDLWDEAKNTEILRWAADQGARPFGVDISLGIVRAARRVLVRRPDGCIAADVRALPFPPNTFDAIYSMGTIEHSEQYETAAREIARVLKPGGVAIVGVPNKLDPFLRPLLVHLLNHVGRYSYGFEKSFTPGQLRRVLETAGLRVTAETGILFVPGWLRMADLWCHVRGSRLTALTGAMVRPFAWLYRTVPAVRRHGYLTVCVVTKPIERTPADGRRHATPRLT